MAIAMMSPSKEPELPSSVDKNMTVDESETDESESDEIYESDNELFPVNYGASTSTGTSTSTAVLPSSRRSRKKSVLTNNTARAISAPATSHAEPTDLFTANINPDWRPPGEQTFILFHLTKSWKMHA